MLYEDPRSLVARLALGREEFCQRLLTMLILGGPYPKWNSRNSPTPEGVAFLRALDELSFGASRCPEPVVFVDELELAPRHDEERGCAPDYGSLWEGRVWLIELKTERGSHRVDQIPSYLQLASHHFPTLPVDVTYLTPPMAKPPPALEPAQRYSHVTWSQVVPLLLDVWGSADDARVIKVRDGLLRVLGSLESPVSAWRAEWLAAEAVVSPEDAAIAAARATAEDGRQRAVDVAVEDLQVLHDLRIELRTRFKEDDQLRHMLPWLWNASTSGGQALSAGGEDHGYELRVSRYTKPQY